MFLVSISVILSTKIKFAPKKLFSVYLSCPQKIINYLFSRFIIKCLLKLKAFRFESFFARKNIFKINNFKTFQVLIIKKKDYF